MVAARKLGIAQTGLIREVRVTAIELLTTDTMNSHIIILSL